MRKSVTCAFVGFAAAVGVLMVVLTASCKSDPEKPTPAKAGPQSEKILAAYEEGKEYGRLTVLYPLDETLFPPEIAPPTFRWRDSQDDVNEWLVTLDFQDGRGRINACTARTEWTPSDDEWAAVKRRSLGQRATVTILGVRSDAAGTILTAASISIGTSGDPVGAPLFYREVILPFIDAVKDPARLRWRFGEISCKQQPPIVLEKLPVCGNCHSFTADGTTLAMDVDYANSKGSYIIQAIAEEMALKKSSIITWDDYKKDEKEFTFGLLSQISPDGMYAISTVKDRSVFVPRPNLAFSQLFFPIKGILAVYNRQTRTFSALPGADNKELVQSNATWSPDGKYIVFARAKAHRLKKVRDKKSVLLSSEESREFLTEGKTFLFDLYRIPFNDGRGGKAVPLEGASHNGMSNYFARYSPDGKWIVFCKAGSFMLLQPDSELYIIPAAGGKARKLRCNTSRMNSWHSWSPNSRWLVFSSKANTPYTQLFLTHIDEAGRSSPPVLLSRFTAPDRAANIPEFVNAKPGAIKRIRERFVDDFSYLRAGHQLLKEQDYHRAMVAYLKALAKNPNNADAHAALGAILSSTGLHDKARLHLQKAVGLNPDDSRSRRNLGLELAHQGKFPQAMAQYRQAVRIDPKFVAARLNLGSLLMRFNELKEARECLAEAVRLEGDNHSAHYLLGLALRKGGKTTEAVDQYRKALAIRPDYAPAHFALGQVLVNEDHPAEAEKHLTVAIKAEPKTPHQHLFLGLALAKQNKMDRAADAFRKELSIQPGNPYAHCELGKILLASDQVPRAAEHFAAAIRANRNVPDFHLQMGRAWQRKGQVRIAVSSWRRAIELKGDLVPALTALAWAYSSDPNDRVRDGKQAVAMAQRACEHAGDKAPAQLDALAAAYAEAGRFKEAVETAGKAAALAAQSGQADLAGRIAERLSLYRAGKPFRRPSP